MIYGDIGLVIFEMASAIFLLWLTGYSKKIPNSKWRILYAVPAIVAINMAGFYGFEISMLGVYLASMILLYGFFFEQSDKKRLSCILAIVSVLISLVVCTGYSGYRAPDYVKDFKKGFHQMKEHYILSEHKGIDWDALYDEYLPKFEKVNQNHSAVDNAVVWQEFCQEFYDGHVSFTPDGGSDAIRQAGKKAFGNDYGLSMMRLTSGEFVAVNVEPGSIVSDAGIHNGTIILEWNGKSPLEYYDEVGVLAFSQPDEENRQFYLPLYVAGLGSDTVDIQFLSDSGEKTTVSAGKIGAYITRLEDTIQILDQGIAAENLSFTMESEDTALLRISQMMYDSDTYSSTDYSIMQQELRGKISELRNKGVSNLILDLRNNGGGSPHMMMGIASLFAPQGKHTYASVGKFDEKSASYMVDKTTGKYVTDGDLSYNGENLWADGQIVILVNAECISAGDHLLYAMSEYPNVVIMGFTKSNGSGQAVNSISLESGMLTYSCIPTLDGEGNILIDSGTDHVAGVSLDQKVPFDETAVTALFDEQEDYLLSYAIRFMKEK